MANRQTQQRRAREKSGRRAEASAALWLQLKGYRILDRRARTPHGENFRVRRRVMPQIDLVAGLTDHPSV